MSEKNESTVMRKRLNSHFSSRDRSNIDDNWRVKKEPVKQQISPTSSLKNDVLMQNTGNIDNIVNNINSVNTNVNTIRYGQESLNGDVRKEMDKPVRYNRETPDQNQNNNFNMMNGLGPSTAVPYPPQYGYQYPNQYPNQYMMQYNQYPPMNPYSYYSQPNMVNNGLYNNNQYNQPNLVNQSNLVNQQNAVNQKSDFLVPKYEEAKKDKPSKYGIINIASFKKDYPRFFDEVLFRYMCYDDYDIIDSSSN